MLKTIILPRQARDKHRERLRPKKLFSAGGIEVHADTVNAKLSVYIKSQASSLISRCFLEIWSLSAAEACAAEGDDDCGDEACGPCWMLCVKPEQPQQPMKPEQPGLCVAADRVGMEIQRCFSLSTQRAAHEGIRVRLAVGMVTIVRSGDFLSVRDSSSPEAAAAAAPAAAAAAIAKAATAIPAAVAAAQQDAAEGERAVLLRELQAQLSRERARRSDRVPPDEMSTDTHAAVHGILFEHRWVGDGFDPRVHWEDGFPTEEQALSAGSDWPAEEPQPPRNQPGSPSRDL